jgi:outer membrane receptor for ferric coprogen and ferric-rhodotorulic acid
MANGAWTEAVFTFNVNNLFDKHYYTNIGFYDSAYPGDPRNMMVTTRWDF